MIISDLDLGIDWAIRFHFLVLGLLAGICCSVVPPLLVTWRPGDKHQICDDENGQRYPEYQTPLY